MFPALDLVPNHSKYINNQLHCALSKAVFAFIFLLKPIPTVSVESLSSTPFHQQTTKYNFQLESFSSAFALSPLTPVQTANSTAVTSSGATLQEFESGVNTAFGLHSPSTRPLSPYIREPRHDMDDLSSLFALALCYLFSALAVAGLLGNLLVIIVIVRNTHLQTTTNILIMCAYLLSDILECLSYARTRTRLGLFSFSEILLSSLFFASSLSCAHILFIVGVIPFSVVENIQVSPNNELITLKL